MYGTGQQPLYSPSMMRSGSMYNNQPSYHSTQSLPPQPGSSGMSPSSIYHQPQQLQQQTQQPRLQQHQRSYSTGLSIFTIDLYDLIGITCLTFASDFVVTLKTVLRLTHKWTIFFFVGDYQDIKLYYLFCWSLKAVTLMFCLFQWSLTRKSVAGVSMKSNMFFFEV